MHEAFLAVVLIFGGQPLLRVWINDEIASRSYLILVIHTLTFALIAGMMIVWSLAEGFRFPFYNTLATLVWMLVGIPLMVLTADRWNIEGIAASRLAGVAITLPVLFMIEKRCLGGIRWRFWRSTLWRIGVASLVMIAVLTGYFHFFEPKWLVLVSGFAAGGMAFFISLLAVGFFTTDEREMFVSIISRRRV